MSSGKTAHYQLHLWQPEDAFVRAEFNDNSQKVDAAMAAKCESSTFQAHKQSIEAAVAAKADNAAFQAHKTSIEAAVAAKADNAELQALKQSVNATVPGKCEVTVGSYRGNWSEGTPSQHIVLGRQPKAVIVWENASGNTQNNYGPCYGMGVTGCSGAGVTITADGFTVRTTSNGVGTLYPSLNFSSKYYMYLAIF